MDPDRTAPAGVAWSGSILFAPILANTKNLLEVCEVDCHIGPDKDGLCTYNPNDLNMCFGCSKTRLIETVLLSTHNICFG